jgi:multidrug efflux system outer membrane protein
MTRRGRGAPLSIHRGKLVACLALALCACALPSPRVSAPVDADVPGAWADAGTPGEGRSTSLAGWWSRFDDPLLGSLVLQALQANTSVVGAQAALRQARALRDVAAAGLSPNVGSSAAAQRNTTGNNDPANNFKLGLDASWEVDVFGANRSALRASEAAAFASAASLGDVQVSIAAEVALAYVTLRGAQLRLAIAGANLASQEETLQLTQWRQQAGLVTALEVEQALAASAQTRAQLPVLRKSIEQAGYALSVLTGRPPAELSGVLAAPGPVPRAANDLALDIPAQTLRQRPDVRAAEYQVVAAIARVSQADAARLPNFKLGGSVGLNALSLGALTNGASVVTALLASVSLPVFDGGALRGQVRVQEAALEQAVSAYRAAVLKALKDVEDALAALRHDLEREISLQQAAASADNAATLARQRFTSGLVDFQVVLETQRTLLNTQDSLAGVRADLGADYVRLYKALGGGWRPEDAEAAVRPDERSGSSALR